MALYILNLTTNELNDFLKNQNVYDPSEENIEKINELLDFSTFVSKAECIERAQKLTEIALYENTTPMVENKSRAILIDPPGFFAVYLEKELLTQGLKPVYCIYNDKDEIIGFQIIAEAIKPMNTIMLDMPENLSLDDLKKAKMDEMKFKYSQEISEGVVALPVLYPENRFSILEESLTRYKAIVDFAELNNMETVPYLYDIVGNRLENVPLSHAKQGLSLCFVKALELYDKLRISLKKCEAITEETKDELQNIVW